MTFAILLLAMCGQVFAQVAADTPAVKLPSSARRTVEYSVGASVDRTGNLYINAWSHLPSVLTFVNSDGSVTVCSSDESAETTYVYEYSANLEERKTLHFKNEFARLGAFTKDLDGNYYFFYAARAAGQNAENMAMVKRGREGEMIKTYKRIANHQDSFGGIRVPFKAGTCRLELSGSLLAVYLARERFDGHQASYGFVLDKDTFERVDKGDAYYYTDGKYPIGRNLISFTGHSFNQFVLPIDGGFIFADHGDAYPRAFTFGRFLNGSDTKRLNAFAFPGSRGQNATYAEMGGLAKTSSGYIFAAAYGKTGTASRNLFTLTFDEDLKACSAPLYLTNYTKDDGHAGHVKIVSLNAGRCLLLWELFGYSTQSANTISSGRTDYRSTFMLVIDEHGKALTEPRQLEGIRLNINDTLRYSQRNGKVYWAINDSNTSITVYALDVGNAGD